ncbi:MAG: GAF and ANTAR domain-containing protein [Nocardioidaceae bacterium]
MAGPETPSAGSGTDDSHTEIGRICASCIDDVQVDGGGVSVVTTRGFAGTVWVSDTTAARVEELQFSLGEGPCFEAVSTRRPVLVPDLADTSGEASRWPGFRSEAASSGIGAIFGLPLNAGTFTLGALDLYRREPGPLTRDEVHRARRAADDASNALLELNLDQASAEPPGATYHWVVHQAAGMITRQLRVPIGDAMLHLRAAAYSEGIPIDAFAAEIVDRRRRLSKEDT